MQFVFVALIFGTSYVYMCHIQHDYGHKLVSTVLSANGDLVEIGKHSVHCFNCTDLQYAVPVSCWSRFLHLPYTGSSPMFYECHNLPCLCVEEQVSGAGCGAGVLA